MASWRYEVVATDWRWGAVATTGARGPGRVSRSAMVVARLAQRGASIAVVAFCGLFIAGGCGRTSDTSVNAGADGGADALPDAQRDAASDTARDSRPDTVSVPESCEPRGLHCTIGNTSCTCHAYQQPPWLCEQGSASVSKPAGVPDELIVEGTACTIEGAYCSNLDTCSPLCQCVDQRWQCQERKCPPIECPERDEAVSGAACFRFGERCQYEGFCGPDCICGVDKNGGWSWACLTPPC